MSSKQAAKAKEEALADLYEEHYDRIARYVFVRIGNQSEAEDIASEVFLKALASLDSYQERGLPMEAWLFKIAHNLLVDYWRKASKRQTVPIDDMTITDEHSLEEMAETEFQIGRLSEALQRLPANQREVIALRFLGERTATEAGRVLGKKAGAVREMQRVALQSLRRALDKVT